MAQRGCTSVARNFAALKNEIALAKVRGVVAGVVDLAADVPDETKLPVISNRPINAILIDFIEISDLGPGGWSSFFMPQYCQQLPLPAPRKLLNAHHFLAVNRGFYPEQASQGRSRF